MCKQSSNPTALSRVTTESEHNLPLSLYSHTLFHSDSEIKTYYVISSNVVEISWDIKGNLQPFSEEEMKSVPHQESPDS